MQRLGEAVFGAWPISESLSDTEALETPLGQYLRDEFFPAQLDAGVIRGTMTRLASAFTTRIISRFRSDRSTFADWCRINIHDLAIQEALAQFQVAAQQANARQTVITKQVLEQPTLKQLRALNAQLAEFSIYQRRFSQLSVGVRQLVWHLFFDAPVHDQPATKIRLSQAATWVFNLSRRQNELFPASRAAEFAQDFFEHKVLHGDFLLRFRTELGSSFNQWLRISVENFTRDHFPNPHVEVQTFSEALANALNTEGERVQQGRRPSTKVGELAGETTKFLAALDEADETLFAMTPAEFDTADPMPLDDRQQRQMVLQVQVLPAVFADPFQRVFSKLMFDFPLSHEDYVVLAREWLLAWAVEFAVERLGGKRASFDSPSPVLQAIYQQFAALCKHSVPPQSKPTLSDDAAAALAEWVRSELTHWPTGKRIVPLELPAGMRRVAESDIVQRELTTLHQALMAAEHAQPGGRITLVDGLGQALEQEVGRLEATRNIASTKDRMEVEKALKRLEWRILRLEAKQKTLEQNTPNPADDSLEAIKLKLAQLHRAHEQRTKELARHVNSRDDTELAILLRREPAVISSLKNRVKRAFADFMHVDHLTKQRKVLSNALSRKPGKALLEQYEREIRLLATFEAFPKQPAVTKELATALGERWSDTIALMYLRALVAWRQGRGDAVLLDLRGRVLRRDELVRQGATVSDCIEFERRGLQVFAAMLWLKRLNEAENG